ncbi:MAG: glycosyl hydrolase family 28-related protein [Spirochaetota bacterium]
MERSCKWENGRTGARLFFMCIIACASLPAANFKPVFSGSTLVVAAAVATEAPYNADATGKTDASSAIQKALEAAANSGGGTVFLPAGRYRIEKSIAMPAAVTLCGEWKRPEPGDPLSGTVLLAYADKGNASGPALLSPPKLGHANVFNMTIYYPEQNPASPVAYPFSIDGNVAYIHNITLVNSYQGIMMSGFSGSSVANICGTALYRGIILRSSTELCTCYNVRIKSDYWTKLPEAKMSDADAAQVRSFMGKELIGVQVGKVDGLSFYNGDLEEAKYPVIVKMEDSEQKAMVTARSRYGFGGGIGKVRGRRTDIEGGWYFGTHYFDLDNYPELSDKRYAFAVQRTPAKSGAASVYQASDYGVAADGKTGESAALQKALNAVASAGGGTLLLPRGTVRLNAPIDIPAGVELRGGYLGAPVRSWYMKVSSLIIDFDADTKDSENARAAITMKERSGLRGVNICHERNLWETNSTGGLVIHPYPYAVRGAGKGIYIYDVIVPNAYNGIDLGASRCDDAHIVGLWGTMYRCGIRVGGGSENVVLENISIDIGPLTQEYRLMTQFPKPAYPAGADKRRVQQAYLSEHAISYVFGDCRDLTTFHLSGFAPHRFMEFIDQGKGGCQDGKFWSTEFDVPAVESVRFRTAGANTFYGIFATGGGNGYSLWAEFDDTFTGSVDVYGLNQQLTFNNHAVSVGPERLRLHLEHSLTTGRPVTASTFKEGSAQLNSDYSSGIYSTTGFGPENALDGDTRTMWQSKEGAGPHLLTVELAAPALVTRWRTHNAGTHMTRFRNTTQAELYGSADGKEYFKIAEFTNNTKDWVDIPVQCDTPVRYVQLKVIKGVDWESIYNTASIAAFDVFGVPAE